MKNLYSHIIYNKIIFFSFIKHIRDLVISHYISQKRFKEFLLYSDNRILFLLNFEIQISHKLKMPSEL